MGLRRIRSQTREPVVLLRIGAMNDPIGKPAVSNFCVNEGPRLDDGLEPLISEQVEELVEVSIRNVRPSEVNVAAGTFMEAPRDVKADRFDALAMQARKINHPVSNSCSIVGVFADNRYHGTP